MNPVSVPSPWTDLTRLLGTSLCIRDSFVAADDMSAIEEASADQLEEQRRRMYSTVQILQHRGVMPLVTIFQPPRPRQAGGAENRLKDWDLGSGGIRTQLVQGLQYMGDSLFYLYRIPLQTEEFRIQPDLIEVLKQADTGKAICLEAHRLSLENLQHIGCVIDNKSDVVNQRAGASRNIADHLVAIRKLGAYDLKQIIESSEGQLQEIHMQIHHALAKQLDYVAQSRIRHF